MNKEGQLFYYNQGNTYWWQRGKYDLVLDFIKIFCHKNIFPQKKNGKILDIGSGPGNMLDFMKDFGVVYGNDTSPDAREFLKERKFEVVLGDISKGALNCDNNIFSLITMIDSLEHMKKDGEVLKRVFDLLVVGGQVLIAVPAYMFLWGPHDSKYGHYRRYTLRELKEKLEAAGFVVTKISYSQPVFLPVLFILRKIKNIIKSKEDDYVGVPNFLNKILLSFLRLEKYYLRYYNFYFGATLMVVAEKKNK